MIQSIQRKHQSFYTSASKRNYISSNLENDKNVILLNTNETGIRGDLISIDDNGLAIKSQLLVGEANRIIGIAEDDFSGFVYVRIGGIFKDNSQNYIFNSPVVYREMLKISQTELTKATITASEDLYVRLGFPISQTDILINLLYHGWI